MTANDEEISGLMAPLKAEITRLEKELADARLRLLSAAGDDLCRLWSYIEAMISGNVAHRTKGFRLGDSTIQFALKHLADEHKELQDTAAACAMRDATRDELADVLGVVIHLAILCGETPASFAKREMEKLKLRFEVPSGVLENCLTLAQLIAENEKLRCERDEWKRLHDLRTEQFNRLLAESGKALSARERELGERDRQWLDVLHPGNANTMLGQTYNDLEKYKGFKHAQDCHKIEQQDWNGKLQDCLARLSIALYGHDQAYYDSDDSDGDSWRDNIDRFTLTLVNLIQSSTKSELTALQAKLARLEAAFRSALGDFEYEVEYGEMPAWTRNRLRISRDRALRAIQSLAPPTAEAKSPAKIRRVVRFEFDDRSLVSVEELKARGFRFTEIETPNGVMFIPAAEAGTET